MPRFITPLLGSVIAAAFLAVRPAAASVPTESTGGPCGGGWQTSACWLGDYQQLAEYCDMACPNWTYITCNSDSAFTCFDDPI